MTEEIKEFELHNKIVDLISDLAALSEKHNKARDQNKIYHRGIKNGIDLTIVKLNEILRIYQEIEQQNEINQNGFHYIENKGVRK